MIYQMKCRYCSWISCGPDVEVLLNERRRHDRAAHTRRPLLHNGRKGRG